MRKIIAGVIFIAFAGVCVWQAFPWYATVGSLLLGASIIFPKVITNAVKTLGANVKVIVKALKERNNAQ